MKKFALIGIAAVVAACSDVPIDGMSRSGWDDPVTLPPANYAKDVWVDARGCVFFATGTPSNRGWAPYVGVGLKQVCRN